MTERDGDQSNTTPVRQSYSPPKMVALGRVRDLTLSGGTSVSDSKFGTKQKATM